MLVDGEWMNWSYWSKCSTTCDEGTKWRTRGCTTPTDGGYSCSGNNTQYELCQLEKCFGMIKIFLSFNFCSYK